MNRWKSILGAVAVCITASVLPASADTTTSSCGGLGPLPAACASLTMPSSVDPSCTAASGGQSCSIVTSIGAAGWSPIILLPGNLSLSGSLTLTAVFSDHKVVRVMSGSISTLWLPTQTGHVALRLANDSDRIFVPLGSCAQVYLTKGSATATAVVPLAQVNVVQGRESQSFDANPGFLVATICGG